MGRRRREQERGRNGNGVGMGFVREQERHNPKRIVVGSL